MSREVGDGFRGQPAFGPRKFLRSTSEADRWSGCPIGGMGRTVSDTGSGCVVAATAGLIRLGRSPAALLVAKHQDKSGSCPLLNDVCLRALTTKPKKLAAQRLHRKCAIILQGTDRQNPIPIRAIGAIPPGDRAVL